MSIGYSSSVIWMKLRTEVTSPIAKKPLPEVQAAATSKVWRDSGKACFSPPRSRRKKEAMLLKGASITAFLLLLPLLSSPFLIFSRVVVSDTSRVKTLAFCPDHPKEYRNLLGDLTCFTTTLEGVPLTGLAERFADVHSSSETSIDRYG